MMERLESWKLAIERLRSAEPVDWAEAGRLIAEIARMSTDVTLRQAAEQALPVLRQTVDNDDRSVMLAAQRRLGVVLDVVHGLTAPRFGRRNATPKKLSSEDRARKVLGLPLAVQLTCDDINQAYRRAAKGMHPDRGGSAEAFIDLAAARDLLIHPGAHKDAWERSDEIS
ncbi:molecular chaperone DnaJ [Bradyrhizobium diazoefficiens]|uniref:Bll6670 protein n=2 Tax=Bradyrhizobium diazoefficiens TaxID=1355477 RepID=Q89FM9_BRADU|nr:molecular chaperone DnaJ [Bradyrhizobium diazoefficiens]AND91699.1 molecular chaperone DnaJ [Bradyrhizobium diazoefficiens USDA 110]QBP25411.1 J domain-containing protein [Bradyrhizobium diazoefficiens]QLD41715.1 J domain-containing protein [Bradyrhizobium diazoefficiens]WLB36821.1 J domain-containing protein [Bradyrhizobium diazoefficiens]WLC18258.1 J domain-containing protein [Bradyrhizobium diazoefficiens]